jgi:hypothetical protein
MELLSILLSEGVEFLGTPVFDSQDFWKMVAKTIFNVIIITVIVRYIYYPVTKNKDYLFTYFLISLTVFLLCVLLDSVKLQLGFALGLFAIFGIIRYRTDPIPIKEMTYLFLVIGISVVNALSNKKISHAELVFANLLIVFITFGMERIWLLKHEIRKNVIYEKIELIAPEKREELIADLKVRTGLNISRIEIRRIDFLKDIANIRIFYYEDDLNSSSQIGLTVLSFFIPLVGLILYLVWRDSKPQEAENCGKGALWGVATVIIFWIIISMVVAIFTAFPVLSY